MHRSGTSLTASWLERCGLKIHDGVLGGADPGNPMGHFEDSSFVDLQEGALMAHAPDSFGWKCYESTQLRFEGEHLETAMGITRQRMSRNRPWGWKDPRTLFFLPHWKEIMPCLKVLLLWRPCQQVAWSLVRRAGIIKNPTYDISARNAVLLWKTHNEMVCRYMERYPDDTLVVATGDIIGSGDSILKRINRKLGIALGHIPVSDLYEKALFTRSVPPEQSETIGSLMKQFRCDALEERLSTLSYQPKPENVSTDE